MNVDRCHKCNGVPPQNFDELLTKNNLSRDNIELWQHKDCYNKNNNKASKIEFVSKT